MTNELDRTRFLTAVDGVAAARNTVFRDFRAPEFDRIDRAEQDLASIPKYAYFLKTVLYHNCGCERMTPYIDSVGAAYLRREGKN